MKKTDPDKGKQMTTATIRQSGGVENTSKKNQQEDIDLADIVSQRKGDSEVEMDIDDL